MNRKKLIQIIVIVGGFAASGAIIYNGFFKSSGSTPVLVNQNLPQNQTSAAQAGGVAAGPGNAGELLPPGASLDFSKVLDKHGLRFGVVNYPQLDPDSEVGVPVDQLIKTQPQSK
jgi:hypothetical protein